MKSSYLVYLGWNLVGAIALIGLALSAEGQKIGPVFLAIGLGPWIVLGGMVGLALVALIHRGSDLPAAVTGTSAYAGAVVTTALLAPWAFGLL